jgi:anti-anti-sigma regulatory factor
MTPAHSILSVLLIILDTSGLALKIHFKRNSEEEIQGRWSFGPKYVSLGVRSIQLNVLSRKILKMSSDEYLNMEVSRIDGQGEVRWVLAGDMDEDSVLRFESLVLNSRDRGSSVIIDMSDLTDIPEIGARGMGHIARSLERDGSTVNIVGAKGTVSRKLRNSGMIEDQ